jgi:hypothetical protein
MSSSHEPDTPFGSAHRWDTFHDAQVIDECSGVVVDTLYVSQRIATSRATRGGAADAHREPTPLDSNRLGFLPLAEWEEYNSYEEDTPSRLQYSIE